MTQNMNGIYANNRSVVSVELVPRDAAALTTELLLLKNRFSMVDLVNIPDLPRFTMRSWEGCALARTCFPATVPHIRACDIDPDRPLPMSNFLRTHGIDQVLVVAGDPHPDPFFPQYTMGSLGVIRKFRVEMPEVKVYAAIDPYRSGFQAESHYAREKIEAGATGFFTQPFFDLRLMEIYREILGDMTVFWGISPVTTSQSQRYWEKRNKALFPGSFEPTLQWNIDFAHEAIAFSKGAGQHVYLMPITIDLENYLDGLFPKS